MRVAICSVGSELVTGHVVDTNAAWLAGRVIESGCSVTAEMIVGDDRRLLVEAFTWLADRSDVLVVGGGLGPTSDDLTRYAVAEFAGVELELRDELVTHLENVYTKLERPMPPATLNQAEVPATASVHPPLGTAAGFVLDTEHDGRQLTIHVLPGVPWEYRGTADAEVLPDLVERSGGQARITRVLHVAGMGESGVGDLLHPLTDRLETALADPEHPEHGVELGFLANADEVLVRVSATGRSPQHARERAAPVVEEAAAALGDAVTSVDDRKLEDELAHLLESGGFTVATAETFTAGRIAASLSSVPNAPSYLRGGLLGYTTEAVVETFGLDPELLERHGMVSREVTEAMAREAQRRFRTDFSIAATGVVSGSTQDGEPDVGTAIWSVGLPDGSTETEERFIPAADREIIQVRGAAFALEALRRQVLSGASGAAGQVTP